MAMMMVMMMMVMVKRETRWWRTQALYYGWLWQRLSVLCCVVLYCIVMYDTINHETGRKDVGWSGEMRAIADGALSEKQPFADKTIPKKAEPLWLIKYLAPLQNWGRDGSIMDPRERKKGCKGGGAIEIPTNQPTNQQTKLECIHHLLTHSLIPPTPPLPSPSPSPPLSPPPSLLLFPLLLSLPSPSRSRWLWL